MLVAAMNDTAPFGTPGNDKGKMWPKSRRVGLYAIVISEHTADVEVSEQIPEPLDVLRSASTLSPTLGPHSA